MNNLKLDRFIKNPKGDKVEMTVTSLNLEKRQLQFIKENNVNLSQLVRALIDDMMNQPK